MESESPNEDSDKNNNAIADRIIFFIAAPEFKGYGPLLFTLKLYGQEDFNFMACATGTLPNAKVSLLPEVKYLLKLNFSNPIRSM